MPVSAAATVEDLAAKRRQIQETVQRLLLRNRELQELQAETQRRRDQIRVERDRARMQMALRRRLVSTAEGRAAAAVLEAALTLTAISVNDIWIDYAALGGSSSPWRIEQMVTGRLPILRIDHDRLVLALNDRLDDAGWGRPLSYWDGTH